MAEEAIKASVAEEEGAANPTVSRRRRKIIERREKLPVWGAKKKFLEAFAKHAVVFVAAPPGSGKSTQIPQFVVESGYAKMKGKKIACTQPRRLAAKALSQRVAQEMDVKLGEEVGYSVLFESCCSSGTILKFLTDGMLLREALSDQFLDAYGVVILDEAHLRTLATDFLLAYLKRLSCVRFDLKIVVMSAQVEAKSFRDYFGEGQIIQPVVRLHPVEIIYTKNPVRDFVQASVERVMQIVLSEPAGDIIVFLTGLEEIENCCWRLEKMIEELGSKVGPIRVLPLHSAASAEMLKNAFKGAPPPAKKGGPVGRKVVVTAEIAESSLAIDGITYVIDCGYTKQKVYNAQLGVESLLILPISKASAQRRAGCARRSAPGKCFRLNSKEFFETCQAHVSPEILRADLLSTVLQVKKLGFEDALHLPWMDPPAAESVMHAVDTLKCLGALDGDGNLTETGNIMIQFPLDPPLSKAIISSPRFHCSEEILSIAAMLSVSNCFLQPTENRQAADEARANFYHVNGDHLTLLNVYHAYRLCSGDSIWCENNFIDQAVMRTADNIRNQLASTMKRLNIELVSTEFKSDDNSNIRKALLSGYFMQVAYLEPPGQYLTTKGNHVVDLHPSSALLQWQPKCIIYNDFVFASRNFVRIVTEVQQDWLADVTSQFAV